MEEALSVADLRLVISGEMREAYENAFREKFWVTRRWFRIALSGKWRVLFRKLRSAPA